MSMNMLLGILALIGGDKDRYIEEETLTRQPRETAPMGPMGPGRVELTFEDLLPEPVYIETAQATTRLDPTQPYYEEQLIAVHAPEYERLQSIRVEAREKAGIIQPEYEAPIMPREARGRR